METIVHGIDITSSALFGMRARSILRGKTREQKREILEAATAYHRKGMAPVAPTVKVVPASSCHCHVADTDNNGVCYTCGGYLASRDAGRYI